MSKRKLFLIVMVLTIASSLLVAYSSRQKDTASAVDRPAVHAQKVNTNLDSSAAQRWSGEVFLSDNGHPDLQQQTRIAQEQVAKPDCISLDDVNSSRRHGGCAE